jgi:hypothetical protein
MGEKMLQTHFIATILHHRILDSITWRNNVIYCSERDGNMSTKNGAIKFTANFAITILNENVLYAAAADADAVFMYEDVFYDGKFMFNMLCVDSTADASQQRLVRVVRGYFGALTISLYFGYCCSDDEDRKA